MEVRWSLEAADDLEGIVRYIRRDNPEVARKVATIVIDAVEVIRIYHGAQNWP